MSDIQSNHIKALKNAIKNGHTPGNLFTHWVCFCKKCHAPLSFFSKGEEIDGLSGSKCNG